MIEVAGPNSLTVRMVDEQTATLFGESAAPTELVVMADGEPLFTDGDALLAFQSSAYEFSDHRVRDFTSNAVGAGVTPSPKAIAKRTEYSESDIRHVLEEKTCAACGQHSDDGAVVTLGDVVWVHATCLRPFISAIKPAIHMYDHYGGEKEFDDQAVSHPINEQPVVCLRRPVVGGYTSSTYYDSERQPSLAGDKYYVNSSLLGIAPAELEGYIARLRRPPEPDAGSSVGVRHGKTPFYVVDGCPRDMGGFPSRKEVFPTAEQPTEWQTDWLIESMANGLANHSCLVCDEQHDLDSFLFLGIRNEIWCHEGCAATLADALEKAWDRTDVLLGDEVVGTD